MSFARSPLPSHITVALREFIQSQKFSGLLLIFCTAVSIFLSNSFFSESYIHFWHEPVFSSFPGLPGGMNAELVVNDILMAFFFLLVGLEIKRELVSGELSAFSKASLPVAAAIGGMVFPAVIYTAFNAGLPSASGWGIPMATDIAFAIGVMSILGKRVPDSLRILLTALAVVDDLGAVAVIALFYSGSISGTYLMYAGLVVICLMLMNRMKVRYVFPYLLLGAVLWYFVLMSGVHATIAGVLLAFTIPYNRKKDKSPLTTLEHWLHAPVNYCIMPVFALANTAMVIPADFIKNLQSMESAGIGLGLIFGKPIGILLFIWLAVKIRISSMPVHSNFRQMLGIGFLGGIGFTMSIFISLLAFDDPLHVLNGKITILIASLVAGITGFFLLKGAVKEKQGIPRSR